MSRRPPQVVSTINLPSGKVLEVVKADGTAPYTRVKTAPADRDRVERFIAALNAGAILPEDF